MISLQETSSQINELANQWNALFKTLNEEQISEHRNSQHRNIKQIVGHMIDSASNNTHRIIHLQYQDSPISFPDYANLGNNERWIAIQNYEDEEWLTLICVWKYVHLHLAHVILQVDYTQLEKLWISALNDKVSLEAMIEDFPKHMELHLAQIDNLIAQE